jgi:hypothetical protein
MLDSLTMRCQRANAALTAAMIAYRAVMTDPTSTADAQNGARTALTNAQAACAPLRIQLSDQMLAALA